MTRLPEAVAWLCGAGQLAAMLHLPEGKTRAALIMLPGGSDYRTGSHRSYVRMAEKLRSHGIATLRMDCRGMGDSEGSHPGFEQLAADVSSAIAFVHERLPATPLFLFGQCDAATAILLASPQLPVAGMILTNPWAQLDTDAPTTIAAVHARQQLAFGPLWQRLLRGELSLAKIRRALAALMASPSRPADQGFQVPLREVLSNPCVPTLIITGSKDLTGAHFGHWLGRMAGGKLSVRHVDQADHSFSRPEQAARLLELLCGFVDQQLSGQSLG